MEPTIYKPGVYNTPGVYKGAGGIYKGRGGGGGEFVEIGGRKYNLVKIGNLLWIDENLDWKLDGVIIGGGFDSSTTPHAWYYDNNENEYSVNGRRTGLLYNKWAADLVNSSLPNGWRVPDIDDFDSLLNYTLSAIKSVDLWTTPGTNESGFNGKPTGAVINIGSPQRFTGVNSIFEIASITDNTSTSRKIFCVYNTYMQKDFSQNANALPIRVCKDP